MRVGVLTYFRNQNRGAMLQADCLRRALATAIPDARVELIDYLSSSHWRQIKKEARENGPWQRLPVRLMDLRRCQRVVDRHMQPTRERLVTDNRDRAVNWLNGLGLQLVVAGSDEIWKTSPENAVPGHVIASSTKRPFPSVFFLGADLRMPTATYAASANRTVLSDFPAAVRTRMSELVASIGHVTVRDHYTQSLVRDLGLPEPPRVPDPTILHPPAGAEVDTILRRAGIKPEDRVLAIHGVSGPWVVDACTRARKEGLRVVSPGYSPLADVNLEGRLDPWQHYAAFGRFEFVLTSRFHSVIFSMLHGRPFFACDTSAVYTRVMSKIKSLLTDCGLTDRYRLLASGEAPSPGELEQLRRPLPADLGARLAALRDVGSRQLGRIAELAESR